MSNLLKAATAVESAPSGWQPIATAPKDGTWIWLAGIDTALDAAEEDFGYWDMMAKQWYIEGVQWVDDLSSIGVTHWHPYIRLPPLPEEEACPNALPAAAPAGGDGR
jgi:hypothetical protein